jgi:hypothetical protein
LIILSFGLHRNIWTNILNKISTGISFILSWVYNSVEARSLWWKAWSGLEDRSIDVGIVKISLWNVIAEERLLLCISSLTEHIHLSSQM